MTEYFQPWRIKPEIPWEPPSIDLDLYKALLAYSFMLPTWRGLPGVLVDYEPVVVISFWYRQSTFNLAVAAILGVCMLIA